MVMATLTKSGTTSSVNFYDLDPAFDPADVDGDGVVNSADPRPSDWQVTALDSDGDGVDDASDAFPSDATETTDLDGDDW